MELIDHSTLGFLQDNGGSTPQPRQVSDLSSQDSYGRYEEAEHHLRHLEMGKTPSSKDFRGNVNGLVQASGSGSSLLSFQGKNDGRSGFTWRDQEDVGCYERMEGDFGSLLRGNVNTSLVSASSNRAGWLFSEATAVADSSQESDAARGRGITMTQKRPYIVANLPEISYKCHGLLMSQNSSDYGISRIQGESSQASKKKQCMTGASKSSPWSSKPKLSLSSSKDPQSVAAKNRRERISERLKILQDLVPNGNKVDLVTMLEKAISYVKFLQLQVKVLATDEFWPAQGGKAPNIAQVKEAIDAILSSQRSETSSSSK